MQCRRPATSPGRLSRWTRRPLASAQSFQGEARRSFITRAAMQPMNELLRLAWPRRFEGPDRAMAVAGGGSPDRAGWTQARGNGRQRPGSRVKQEPIAAQRGSQEPRRASRPRTRRRRQPGGDRFRLQGPRTGQKRAVLHFSGTNRLAAAGSPGSGRGGGRQWPSRGTGHPPGPSCRLCGLAGTRFHRRPGDRSGNAAGHSPHCTHWSAKACSRAVPGRSERLYLACVDANTRIMKELARPPA
jgi:hypothetical protein